MINLFSFIWLTLIFVVNTVKTADIVFCLECNRILSDYTFCDIDHPESVLNCPEEFVGDVNREFLAQRLIDEVNAESVIESVTEEPPTISNLKFFSSEDSSSIQNLPANEVSETNFLMLNPHVRWPPPEHAHLYSGQILAMPSTFTENNHPITTVSQQQRPQLPQLIVSADSEPSQVECGIKRPLIENENERSKINSKRSAQRRFKTAADISTTKRPLNSFFLFRKKYLEDHPSEFRNIAMSELSNLLAKKWHALTMEEKRIYFQEAEALSSNF